MRFALLLCALLAGCGNDVGRFQIVYVNRSDFQILRVDTSTGHIAKCSAPSGVELEAPVRCNMAPHFSPR